MPPGENSAKREKNPDELSLTQDQDCSLWRELEAVSVAEWLTFDRPFPLPHGYTDSGVSLPARSESHMLTVCLCSGIYLPKTSFLSYKGEITVIPASRATEGIKHAMSGTPIGMWQST